MKNFKYILLSFIVFILSLEIFLRLYALYISPENTKVKIESISILALGESTTAYDFKDQLDWPSQLQKKLGQQNINATVYNEGRRSTTTNSIIERLPTYLDKYQPHIIITMMGKNDTPTFWPKEFILNDSENILTYAKSYKLLKYIWYKITKIEPIVRIKPNLPSSSLNYGEIDELINEINNAKFESKEYREIIQKINLLLQNRTNLEKAQFYSYLASHIESSTRSPKLDYKKNADLYYRAVVADGRVEESANMALHFYVSAGINQYCKQIVNYTKEQNIEMNDTFLLRLASCLPQETEYIKSIFKYAGDNYEYRPQADPPTLQNYLALASQIKDKDICWIAMEYPRRKFSESILALQKLNSPKIFPLANVDKFEIVLKSKKFEDLFVDNFGVEFGHATALGNSLIAENVFEKILQLKNNNLCNL